MNECLRIEMYYLIVFGKGSYNESGQNHWHDKNAGSLHDLGRCQLPVIDFLPFAFQLTRTRRQLLVISIARRLDQGENQDGQSD